MNRVEVDEQGGLYIPSHLLHHTEAYTHYVVEIQDDRLILRPEKTLPFWVTATPAERAEAFREWATMQRPTAPGLPDEALSRESIYQ